MKPSQSRRGFFLAVVVAGACLLPSISSAATTVVGTGPDSSFLVLESPNLGVRTYEIHYTYIPSQQRDSYFLLSQVLTFDNTITVDLGNIGTVEEPNYYINSFTHHSVTEEGAADPPYTPYWTQWVAGGEAGYPTASPVASGSWSFGSGISAPFRLIAPGSLDALFYSDGNSLPSVAPIPETSSLLLTLLGSVAIFQRRRNR